MSIHAAARPSELTITDMFCGAGGSSIGAEAAGGTLAMAANHWQLAVDVHNANFPNAAHDCAEIDQVAPRRYPHTDILIASPSCFPAGTIVLATRGLVPIEKIVVGDKVLTHEGRWRPVTDVMSRVSDTVIISGHGHQGLETTSGHPIWIRHSRKVWENDRRQYGVAVDEPAWVPAGGIVGAGGVTGPAGVGDLWATPTQAEALLVPPVPGRGCDFTPEFWWMVGRWLGDGYLRIRHGAFPPPLRRERRAYRSFPATCEACGGPALSHGQYPHLARFWCSVACKQAVDAKQAVNGSRGSSVHITCGSHETGVLDAKLAFAVPLGARARSSELRWHRRDVRTGSVYESAHNGLVDWLHEHFGQFSYGKTVPSWALTMPVEWRTSLLEGYVSADGSTSARGVYATSVSKRLALGVRLLAESLGHRASLYRYEPHADVIEGRKVEVRPYWVVKWVGDRQRELAVESVGHSWQRIRTVASGRPAVEVFNLSVADDESYIVDGIVVHNCTNHTLAKGMNRAAHRGQLSFDGLGPEEPAEAERSRATMWDVPRFAEYHDYRLIVVENVVDARDWVMYDAWLMAMTSLGYEHRELYLNSMFAGMGDWSAPQSRDRMYVVFWKKGNRAPQLDLHPEAWCSQCEQVVAGVQSWKNPMHPWGKYRSQYLYVCPRCTRQVAPFAFAAAKAIDWSIEAQRIGARDKPLAAATMARIEQGIAKYWGKGGMIVGLDRLRAVKLPVPIDKALTTQAARQDEGLVEMPFVAEMRGTSGARTVKEPLGAVTAGGNHHGLVEPPLVVTNNWHNRARLAGAEPLPTCTTGTTTGVLAPLYIKGYGGVDAAGPMAHPVSDPLGAVTTQDHHALVVPPDGVPSESDGLLVPVAGSTYVRPGANYTRTRSAGEPFATQTTDRDKALVTAPLRGTVSYYRSGRFHPVEEPVGAVTTKDRHGVVEASTPKIEDCTFRMLEPHEIGAAMAFPETYLVDGNKRQKVRLYGNAVTPPTMAWILGRAIASLEEAA